MIKPAPYSRCYSLYSHAITRQQRGATLLVCLVLLLILTIIGAASVQDVNLQSIMTRNSQFRMQAYNVALSEIDGQFAGLQTDETFLVNALTTDGGRKVLEEADMAMAGENNPFEQDVAVEFINSSGVVYNFSLGHFSNYSFEIDSAATLPNTGTTSDQSQGLSFTAPIAN
jgi:hypothetical protein